MKTIFVELQGFEDTSMSSQEFFAPLLKKIKGEKAYQMSALMVKSSRTAEGMSQQKLCELLNMDKGNLSKIENAKRPIGKDLAQKLAKIFHTDYKVFLSGLPKK